MKKTIAQPARPCEVSAVSRLAEMVPWMGRRFFNAAGDNPSFEITFNVVSQAMTTDRQIQIPPWGTRALWHQANAAMAEAVECRGRELDRAVDLAKGIEHGFASVDEALDALCSAHCPDCKDSCCHRAVIWYDFRDLIFLHLTGVALPENQIVRITGRPCPNQGDAGCTIPRTARPFICTWYLCPAQKSALHDFKGDPDFDLIRKLAALKQARIELESQFILAVTA